jgi:hypothetical protein
MRHDVLLRRVVWAVQRGSDGFYRLQYLQNHAAATAVLPKRSCEERIAAACLVMIPTLRLGPAILPRFRRGCIPTDRVFPTGGP